MFPQKLLLLLLLLVPLILRSRLPSAPLCSVHSDTGVNLVFNDAAAAAAAEGPADALLTAGGLENPDAAAVRRRVKTVLRPAGDLGLRGHLGLSSDDLGMGVGDRPTGAALLSPGRPPTPAALS